MESLGKQVVGLETCLERLDCDDVDRFENEDRQRRDLNLRSLDVEAEVLQTKTVPIPEVVSDLQNWTPALADELNSVTTTHKAGSIITDEEAKLLESQPELDVVRVPGKVVASVKPPFKRKARFVACGNYLTRPKHSKSPTLDRHDLYSAGLDSFALRTQLATGACRSWRCASLDVKTAFLTAPLQQPRAQNKTQRERVVLVRVPRVMIMAGLAPPKSWLRVHGALYGLQESPHSWGCSRDGKLKQLSWVTPGGEKIWLEQTASDCSVWLVRSETRIVGTLGVYVDDLLIITEHAHLGPTLNAIRSIWHCSEAEYASKPGGFRFCGLQLEERDGAVGTPKGLPY